MSLDPRDSSKLRAETGRLMTKVRSLVRRMAITLSDGGLWQVAGHAGESEDGVPVFPGIGFASRPAAGGNPECIVVKVGGASGHGVVVATRDESARVNLDEDETAIFNSTGALVKITRDGDIEVSPKSGGNVYVRQEGGSAEALVKKSDFDGHTHAFGTLVCSNGTVSGATAGAPSAAGTETLRGD